MSDAVLLAVAMTLATVVCGTIAYALWDLGRAWWLPTADEERNRDQQHRHRQHGIAIVKEAHNRQQQRYDHQDQKRR